MRDHYIEAESRIRFIRQSRDLTSDQAQVFTTLAQVHATLALAEQQRIANLIALSESGRHTNNGARAALAAIYPNSTDPDKGVPEWELAPEIARALRIENTDEV